jgi:hypothetical protein
MPASPLATAACIFAWISGVLAGITWMVMPRPPMSLVWSILPAAVAGLTLAIPTRHTARGRWALWLCGGSLLVWLFTWQIFFIFNRDDHFTATRPGNEDARRTASASAPSAPASTESLSQPPVLRFLAWKKEQGWTPADTTHSDGTSVTDDHERKLLQQIPPEFDAIDLKKFPAHTRFLQLWFAHPEFNQSTFREVTLLNENGTLLPPSAQGYTISSVKDAGLLTDDLGWITYCLSPGIAEQIPARLTVRLRYTTGELKNTQKVAPDFNSALILEGGSQVSSVGQNAKGRAFIALAEDTSKLELLSFDVLAVTKNGKSLTNAGKSASSAKLGLGVERFQFDVPLAEIDHFLVGTQPIRTQEWKDVALPPWMEAPAPRSSTKCKDACDVLPPKRQEIVTPSTCRE